MIKGLLHCANRSFDEIGMYKTIMLFKFFRVLILQNTKCIFKLDFMLCIAGIILTNFQIRMEKLHFCYMYKNIFGTFLSLMKIQSNMGDQNFASTIAHMSAKGFVYACEQQIFVLMKIQSNTGDWNFVSTIAHICQQKCNVPLAYPYVNWVVKKCLLYLSW